jgi:copper homeostasis protein
VEDRTPLFVEAAVESFAQAAAAEAAGVNRIELCGTLHDGAVTPSAGLIARCVERLRTPIHVFIRPRTGDFVYDADDLAIMSADIALARTAGVAGVVFGALTADGQVDATAMRALVAAARPLAVGFHRAFDQVRDQFEALEVLVRLGVEVVLTSGGAPTALEGAERLRALVERAAGRLVILAGGSITAANVRTIVERSGVRAVHGKAFQELATAARTPW